MFRQNWSDDSVNWAGPGHLLRDRCGELRGDFGQVSGQQRRGFRTGSTGRHQGTTGQAEGTGCKQPDLKVKPLQKDLVSLHSFKIHQIPKKPSVGLFWVCISPFISKNKWNSSFKSCICSWWNFDEYDSWQRVDKCTAPTPIPATLAKVHPVRRAAMVDHDPTSTSTSVATAETHEQKHLIYSTKST